MRASEPPYSARYPELAHLLQDDPAAPRGNVIERNVIRGGTPLELLDGLDAAAAGFRDNLLETDPGFVDEARGDYRLREDGAARRAGIAPIPFERIGADAWRREHPEARPAPAGRR